MTNSTFLALRLEMLGEFIFKPAEINRLEMTKDVIENLDLDQVMHLNELMGQARARGIHIEPVNGGYVFSQPVSVYEDDEPDDRYDEALEQVSVFRPRYRKLSGEELEHHDKIKNAAAQLWDLFNRVDEHHARGGREVAIGKTKLEEAVMWAVKGLTK